MTQNEPTDWDHLQLWAASGAEESFQALVSRYINLVYASARRRLRDAHGAEDATQAVFLLLTQKAKTIRRSESLAAWLFTATRYTTSNMIKAQRRRQHYEKQAAMEQQILSATSDESPEVLPRLDQAMDRLSKSDQTTLLARFFEGKSLQEVGTSLGVSASAAEKRVGRAIERLRKMLAKDGVVAPAPAILSALAVGAAQQAPIGLGSLVMADAGTTIFEIARMASRAMRVHAALVPVLSSAAIVFCLAAIVAVIAMQSPGRDIAATHSAPPSTPATTQALTIDQLLPFDVVAAANPEDPALMQQVVADVGAAESKLQNLRIDSVYTSEKYNPSGTWTPAGSVNQTLWIENHAPWRLRDDVHEEVTEWINGAAPFSRERFVEVFDGTATKHLTTASGTPQKLRSRLEGRISADRPRLWGSPWQSTLYNAAAIFGDLSSYKYRLSTALAGDRHFAARRVTLNGLPCVEVAVKASYVQRVFLDPSRGWALIGDEYTSRNQVISRSLVKSFVSAGPGLQVPESEVGMHGLGELTRYEIHTTGAVANDPGWTEEAFNLDWPTDLTAVWDQRTGKAIRFPTSKPLDTGGL